MNLSENLKLLRNHRKFTLEEVAKFVGVNASLVEKWEEGSAVPTVEQCQILAKLYHISIDTLVYEKMQNKKIGKTKFFFFLSFFILIVSLGYFAYKVTSSKQVNLEFKQQNDWLMVENFEEGFFYKEDMMPMQKDSFSQLHQVKYKCNDRHVLIQFELELLQDKYVNLSVFDAPSGEVFLKEAQGVQEGIYTFEIPQELFNQIQNLSLLVCNLDGTKRDVYPLNELVVFVNNQMELSSWLIEDFENGKDLELGKNNHFSDLTDFRYQWIEDACLMRFEVQLPKEAYGQLTFFDPPNGENLLLQQRNFRQGSFAVKIPSDKIMELNELTISLLVEDQIDWYYINEALLSEIKKDYGTT